MKKVFHFVSTNCLSGLENVVINISTLLRHDYDFTYISPNGPINYYLQKYNINHISVSRLTPLSVRSIINKYHPDIVHGHDVKASLCLAINSHLCHKYHIKMISELHNDDPRMWRYSLRSVLYQLSTYYYDNIIVISHAVINHYIFRNKILNKVAVINNIVNPLRIKYYPVKYKRWDCIFLGRFVNQKNPVKFVQIINILKMKYNKNISAIMLGNGPLLNEVKERIKDLHLTNNIILLGFKKDPYKYLCRSKVLVITSKYEGFGLVALESLLCKVPVIASRTGGLIRIVNNKCGALASTVPEFVKSIIYITQYSSVYKIMSMNAKKRGNHINNVRLFVNSYKEIYNK